MICRHTKFSHILHSGSELLEVKTIGKKAGHRISQRPNIPL